MRENTSTVMGWIGLSEGGKVDHPKDPGGRTNRGITQATFDGFNRAHNRPLRDVFTITKAEAEEILLSQYFAPVKFNDLPSGLDYAVVDFAVNSGVSRAVIELQRALGMSGSQVDGILGNQTLAAISREHTANLIAAYCTRRLNFMKGLSHWKTFKTGWTIRVMGQTDGVQANDIGVIDRATRLARAMTPAAVATIPEPEARQDDSQAAKASDTDRTFATMAGNALKDPVAAVGALAPLAAPLLGGSGPVQWAVAAAVMALVLVVAVRALRRTA